MYSYEEKIKAVKLLIKYDKCYSQVMRELSYQDRKSLMAWYKQYLSNGDLTKECERKTNFSEEEKHSAVNYYLEHGKCLRRTVRKFGYPSKPTLDKWILELAPDSFACIKNIKNSEMFINRWEVFQKKFAINLAFEEAIDFLEVFMSDILHAIALGNEFEGKCQSKSHSW